MGDPLHDLEQRLERMMPPGLSEEGRARLEGQIDQLASQVEEQPAKWRSGWRMVTGLAATIVLVAGVIAVMNHGVPPAQAGETGFEMLTYEREVDDGQDGGIVLSRFNEPMRSWNYKVKEMELILDKESGLKVRIVSERNAAVLTSVTSF